MDIQFKFFTPTYSAGVGLVNPLIPINPYIEISGLNGVILASTRLSLLGSVIAYANDSNNISRRLTFAYIGSTGNLGFSCDVMENMWDYINLTFKITLSGYNNYTNTFRLYNYDMGEISTTNNINMDIILVRPNYGTIANPIILPYSSFISYRVPLTNKVLIYNSNSAPITKRERFVNGSLINHSLSYCNTDLNEFILSEITYYGSYTSTSTRIIPSVKWLPDYQLEIGCINECSLTCQSTTLQENQALINLDFTSVTKWDISGHETESAHNYTFLFELFNHSGLLVASKKYTFNRYSITTHMLYNYFSTLYPFTFTTPEIGDYQIKVTIGVNGQFKQVLTSGDLVTGSYYKITSDLNSDFTLSGASTGALHEVFQANGVAPLWGNGSVTLIENTELIENTDYRIGANVTGTTDFSLSSTPNNINEQYIVFTSNGIQPIFDGNYGIEVVNIYECYDTELIHSCNYFAIEQLNCNTFRVHNHSSIERSVTLETLQTPLTSFLSSGGGKIQPFSYIDFSFVTDGTYRIINNSDDTFFVLHIYCNLLECLKTKIKDLECNCNDACKDKDYYIFNSLMIQALNYFNQINHLYNFNYLFESLSPSDMSQLVNLDEQLARFSKYCIEECDNPCNCS